MTLLELARSLLELTGEDEAGATHQAGGRGSGQALSYRNNIGE